MNGLSCNNADDTILLEVNQSQLNYFTSADERCRGLQLPEGILLRYNLARSLYFYLRTSVEDGKVITRVYSSDTPFDHRKCVIGEVSTPLFDRTGLRFDLEVDRKQVDKLRGLLLTWVNFVCEDLEATSGFSGFALDPQRSNQNSN